MLEHGTQALALYHMVLQSIYQVYCIHQNPNADKVQVKILQNILGVPET